MEIPLTDKFIFLNPSYICIYRSDKDMTSALNALRNREISANKAAKLYKIPSSVSKRPIIVRVTCPYYLHHAISQSWTFQTLYKIARKEKIELAQPFNAVATSWKQEDLESALEAIKNGTPVQKAAAEYGIPR